MEEFFSNNPKAACTCCTTLIVTIILIVALYFSAATVEPISYGVVYSKISKNIDNSTVYEGGWYFIGPLSKFIQYPQTQQNIDFSDLPGSDSGAVVSRTEGVEIQLHFSF